MDLLEILNDRTKYPDDMEIAFADGSKHPVKALRDSLIPRAEFTRTTQTFAEERRNKDQAIEGLTRQLAEATAAAAARAGDPGRAAAVRRMSLEELAEDPVLGPLVEAINQQNTTITKAIQAQQVRIASEQMDKLGITDPAERKAFIDFAADAGSRDYLSVAAKAFKYDADIKKAREEARKEGEEAGRKAARLTVPTGGRRSHPSPPAQDDPAFGDVAAALQDPEVMGALHGEGAA